MRRSWPLTSTVVSSAIEPGTRSPSASTIGSVRAGRASPAVRATRPSAVNDGDGAAPNDAAHVVSVQVRRGAIERAAPAPRAAPSSIGRSNDSRPWNPRPMTNAMIPYVLKWMPSTIGPSVSNRVSSKTTANTAGRPPSPTVTASPDRRQPDDEAEHDRPDRLTGGERPSRRPPSRQQAPQSDGADPYGEGEAAIRPQRRHAAPESRTSRIESCTPPTDRRIGEASRVERRRRGGLIERRWLLVGRNVDRRVGGSAGVELGVHRDAPVRERSEGTSNGAVWRPRHCVRDHEVERNRPRSNPLLELRVDRRPTRRADRVDPGESSAHDGSPGPEPSPGSGGPVRTRLSSVSTVLPGRRPRQSRTTHHPAPNARFNGRTRAPRQARPDRDVSVRLSCVERW